AALMCGGRLWASVTCHRKSDSRRGWASLSRAGEDQERSVSGPPIASTVSQALTATSTSSTLWPGLASGVELKVVDAKPPVRWGTDAGKSSNDRVATSAAGRCDLRYVVHHITSVMWSSRLCGLVLFAVGKPYSLAISCAT